MKSLNIILGNAPINNGNLGCVALTYTSIYLIDKILSEANVGYKLYLSDSGYFEAGNHTIRIANKDISYEEIHHIIPIDKKEGLKYIIKCKSYVNSIKKYRDCDYILDIGQGDSFADIYGSRRFRAIDRIHKEALMCNRPYCILPQTIGPFKETKTKKRGRKSIAQAKVVMVRDKQSLKFALNLVPSQQNIAEYIDMAFFLPYTPISLDKKWIHVGLNISALLWHGGYTKDNQFGLKENYKDMICRIIDYFLSQPNIKLHLIPHVISNEKIEDDYTVAETIVHKYCNPSIVLSEKFKSPVEAKSYISSMDFFMGARMHSTIAAFSSGVPVIPMAYSRKFNGLFEATLNYEHMVNLKVDNTEVVLDKIKNGFLQRITLKDKIQKRLCSVVEERKKRLHNDLKTFFCVQ